MYKKANYTFCKIGCAQVVIGWPQNAKNISLNTIEKQEILC